ncbi:ciliary-associated calcium-binding coiled-coil protein 1 [Empidonax traillii]|uniref:ciliary-associated calcium-binding coiled-coil protein 1 n=1 Tax=Empidonax traillii TaxID=164674 RepID=UPI000FFD3BDC|nr:ciliary-associated calcium-binding coiled-coil protein 1 [Empidonax traillii]
MENVMLSFKVHMEYMRRSYEEDQDQGAVGGKGEDQDQGAVGGKDDQDQDATSGREDQDQDAMGGDEEDQDQDAMGGDEEDQDQGAVGGQEEKANKPFLSLSQITALLEENLEGVEKMLEEFLNFTRLKTSWRKAVLIDYYSTGFLWAKEMNFSLIQLSGFMELLNFVLENISDKHMTLGDNLKELERAMAEIGETDSEQGNDLNFFSIEQGKAIIDYFINSLFKFYRVYELLFRGPRGLELSDEQQQDVIELDQPEVPSSAAATESQGSDQEDYLEESSEADAVAGVTAEDQKSAECEIPNEIIGNLEADINEKLEMQEEA